MSIIYFSVSCTYTYVVYTLSTCKYFRYRYGPVSIIKYREHVVVYVHHICLLHGEHSV